MPCICEGHEHDLTSEYDDNTSQQSER